jgi:hypothetical protein
MVLTWIKCQNEVWCKLNTVNLSHAHFDNMYGVYVIWHGGPKAATVYVGQGNIRERLTQHRTNPSIKEFDSLGLYVTWAAVARPSCDGVEVYLAQQLKPKVGSSYPEAAPIPVPIPVNFPW